jgi:Helix-turn-helix domain
MPKDDDSLLTETQVAELLQVHVQTIRSRRRAGTGPKVTWVGRWPRYWRSDVVAWLEASQPTGEPARTLPDRAPGRQTGKKGRRSSRG